MPRRRSSSNVHGRVIRDEEIEASGGSIAAFYVKGESESVGPPQQKANEKSEGKLLETRGLPMVNKSSAPPAKSLHIFAFFLMYLSYSKSASVRLLVRCWVHFFLYYPVFRERARTHTHICIYTCVYFSLFHSSSTL